MDIMVPPSRPMMAGLADLRPHRAGFRHLTSANVAVLNDLDHRAAEAGPALLATLCRRPGRRRRRPRSGLRRRPVDSRRLPPPVCDRRGPGVPLRGIRLDRHTHPRPGARRSGRNPAGTRCGCRPRPRPSEAGAAGRHAALAVVIDTFEQWTKRAGQLRAFDSRETEAQPLKSQLGVNGEAGRLVNVPDPDSGPTTDIARQGRPRAPGEAAGGPAVHPGVRPPDRARTRDWAGTAVASRGGLESARPPGSWEAGEGDPRPGRRGGSGPGRPPETAKGRGQERPHLMVSQANRTAGLRRRKGGARATRAGRLRRAGDGRNERGRRPPGPIASGEEVLGSGESEINGEATRRAVVADQEVGVAGSRARVTERHPSPLHAVWAIKEVGGV